MNENLENFWQHNHQHEKLLSGSKPEEAYKQHQITNLVNGKRSIVLEIGVGTAISIQYLAKKHDVVAVDICSNALMKVDKIAKTYLTKDMPKIDSNSIDFGLSHIVLQHCDDDMVDFIVSNVIRVLKPDGLFSFHFSVGESLQEYTRKRLFKDGLEIEFLDRPVSMLENIIAKNGGVVTKFISYPKKMGKKGDILWYFLHVAKKTI